jgi:hypothetical protein
MKVSAEPGCSLEGVRHRRGAWSVGVSCCAVVCGGLSRLRSVAESTLGVESALGLDRVASIGAQLRSVSVYGTVAVGCSRVNVAWSEKEVPDA